MAAKERFKLNHEFLADEVAAPVVHRKKYEKQLLAMIAFQGQKITVGK